MDLQKEQKFHADGGGALLKQVKSLAVIFVMKMFLQRKIIWSSFSNASKPCLMIVTSIHCVLMRKVIKKVSSVIVMKKI